MIAKAHRMEDAADRCDSVRYILTPGLNIGIPILPQRDKFGMVLGGSVGLPPLLTLKNTGRNGAEPEILEGPQVTGPQGFPRI